MMEEEPVVVGPRLDQQEWKHQVDREEEEPVAVGPRLAQLEWKHQVDQREWKHLVLQSIKYKYKFSIIYLFHFTGFIFLIVI